MSDEKNKGGRPPKYPWLLMEVGEQFSVPRTNTGAPHYIHTANKRYAPRRFKLSRTETDFIFERVA
jgi:hypothetical protein